MLLQISEPKKQTTSPVIGIDFGTTNSVIAHVKGETPKIIPISDISSLMPSIYALNDKDEALIGHEAESFLAHHPEAAVRSIKRLLAKDAGMLADEHISKSYHLKTEGSKTLLKVGNTYKEPIDIAAAIFKEIKEKAESHLSTDVSKAVVTVPAYFDDAARNSVRFAAKLAGIEVLRLIAEPTAAAVAYGLDNQQSGTFMVYDLGGGTFDVSILSIEEGLLRVLATGGDAALGGDDIDHAIAAHCVPTLDTLSISERKQALLKAKHLKHALSTQATATFSFQGENIEISSQTLRTLTTPLIEKTISIMQNTLQDAEMTPADINGILLVGGSTRLPLVKTSLQQTFPNVPLHDQFNPDEVVALGAAIQAHNLTQDNKFLLLDVTPLSLGIETMGGVVEKIIHRNSPLPIAKTQTFTTFKDNQQGMKIHILQGEREMVDDCRSLGEFELTGLTPLPAGQNKIDITYSLDANGLLTVSAAEQHSGTHQSLEVNPRSGLNEQNLEKMLLDSQRHATEDMEHRLLAKAKLDAEQLIKASQKLLNADEHIITPADRSNIENIVKDLEKAKNTTNRDHMNELQKQLEPLILSYSEKIIKETLNAEG